MNTHDHMIDNFNKSELFKDLSADQINEIICIGSAQPLKPKAILFYQGDPAKNYFWVKQGTLKLSQVTEDGKEITLRYISPGDMTAALAVMKQKEYPVTAQAMEPSTVVAWNRSQILKIMEKFPRVAINTLTIVLERLDDMQIRYMELCTQQVEQRIARTLMRFVRTSGKKDANGICIDIPLSRKDIAEYIGTTLFTVSRVLSLWEKKGWLKTRKGQIIILEPHKIVEFSEEM